MPDLVEDEANDDDMPDLELVDDNLLLFDHPNLPEKAELKPNSDVGSNISLSINDIVATYLPAAGKVEFPPPASARTPTLSYTAGTVVTTTAPPTARKVLFPI